MVLPVGMRFVVCEARREICRDAVDRRQQSADDLRVSTEDSQDAHDFGSLEVAMRWASEHGGRVGKLADSGHWSLEE